MTEQDHEYYVKKIEQQEILLRSYRDSFEEINKWFKKNRVMLSEKPISEIPQVPVGK